MTLDLSGRAYLITGVLTAESIAWRCAAALQVAGADVTLTSFGRSARITAHAARSLPKPVEVLELDVRCDSHFESLANELQTRCTQLHGVVHAIAAAPADCLNGNFLAAPRASVLSSFETSAYSFHALAVALAPLLQVTGGSVVGIDFDATAAWAGYDWMGVAKAALESITRYLAMYLGPTGIRVNLVAAGPVETVAGRGIRSYDDIAARWAQQAPLGWDRHRVEQLVGPVLFLLSDLSRCVSGEVVHADGGMHAVSFGLGRANSAESYRGNPASGRRQCPA